MAALGLTPIAHAHETTGTDPNVGGVDYDWTITGLEHGESVTVDER